MLRYKDYIVEQNNNSLIPVIRWASKKIPAAELEHQKFDWGGFEATALCFTPFDGMDDPRIDLWKDMLEKQHKTTLVKNFYYLDCSEFQLKDEKSLTEYAKLSYTSIKAERIMKEEYKIHMTLAQIDKVYKLVEIRLYPGCKIKILDF